MATIRLAIEELAWHEVEVEVEDDLLDRAAEEGFERTTEGAVEFLRGGGSAEEWYADKVGDGSLQSVEFSEVRSAEIL